jgi:transposase
VSVETTADLAGCRSCGVKAAGHGRSVVEIRDLPSDGRPVRLVWRKRRWLCGDPDCDAKSFTEQTPAVERSLTCRATRKTCRRVGEDGHSVAREFGVAWATAMGCVRRHGEPLVCDPGRIEVTGRSASTSARC